VHGLVLEPAVDNQAEDLSKHAKQDTEKDLLVTVNAEELDLG
jgi:hypothetical protein